MTKHAKRPSDISYTVNDESEASSGSDEDGDEEDDAALAKKISKQEDNVMPGQRQSKRLAKNAEAMQDVVEGAAVRERKQIELMARRNEERLRELARAKRKGKGGDKESEKAEELLTYGRTKDYPDNVLPNQVKVDMASKCVILPICGSIPFHCSS